jgi:hypothetical protein
VHILEQPCGQSWIVTRRSIEMIEGSECEFPVGNAGSGRLNMKEHSFMAI